MALVPDAMKPLVIITRPLAQSRRFAEALAQQAPQHEVLISPLSQVVPTAFDAGVFTGVDGLVLTSANAVAPLPPLGAIPAWCVGPATRRAANARGFAAQDCGGDALALAQVLRALPPGLRLVHAHGPHLAVDLVALLRPDGVDLVGVQVYETNDLPLNDEALTALHSGRRIVAPLFSPRAASGFTAVLGGVIPASVVPVAISANAAARLPDDARTRTVVAQTPDSGGMLRGCVVALSHDAPVP